MHFEIYIKLYNVGWEELSVAIEHKVGRHHDWFSYSCLFVMSSNYHMHKMTIDLFTT